MKEYKRIYGAYGANTNIESMDMRCPDATIIGVGKLHGYRLEFKGVADIMPAAGHSMDILIWDITKDCEEALDFFEGFPRMYVKRQLHVELGGVKYPTMFYVMNGVRDLSLASDAYYNCLHEGYGANGMEMKELHQADARAIRTGGKSSKYRSAHWG